MDLLAAALALALSAPGACGLPPLAAQRPFAPGEVLSYDVAVAGVVKGGTLQLAVEAPILGGAQLPLRARARNTSVFAKIRKVKGTGVSFVSARTLRPVRYRDDVDQDGVKRGTDTRLDLPGPTVRMAWTSGAEKGVAEFERQREALDLLSAVYLLRASELRPGAELCFDLLANRRYWRFAGRVAERTERVPTPAGDFDTVKVEARLTRADDPTKGRPLVLWISTDPRRLLVAAGSEVDLGPVVATLVRADE
jgi:hypothetical protein